MASLSPAQAALLTRIFRTAGGVQPGGCLEVTGSNAPRFFARTLRSLWQRGLVGVEGQDAAPVFWPTGITLYATSDGLLWRCPDRKGDYAVHVFSRDEEYDPGNPDNQPMCCEFCGALASDMPARQRAEEA